MFEQLRNGWVNNIVIDPRQDAEAIYNDRYTIPYERFVSNGSRVMFKDLTRI